MTPIFISNALQHPPSNPTVTEDLTQYPHYPSQYPFAYGQPYPAGPDPIHIAPYPDEQHSDSATVPPPKDTHS